MPDKRPDTVVDPGKQVLRCNICGDEFPVPLGNMDFVTGIFEVWGKAHENCNGRPGKTFTDYKRETGHDQNNCQFCFQPLNATELIGVYECPECLKKFPGAKSIKKIMEEYNVKSKK